MVDISSVQQDSITVQSLQNIGGSIVDASNNFFVNTSIMFMGNTTTSVIIQSSGIYTPSIELDGTTANLSINTTSLMLKTTTANLYIDVNEANFPGDVTVLGSILLTGSFVSNGTNGNTGDVLVSDGTISYWSSAANNSTYAYGKTEGNLNVNNSLTSNNASYLGGIAANQYAYANQAASSANNASYLGGVAAASYIQNTDSRTLSGNLNFTGSNVQFSSYYLGNDSQIRFRTVNSAAYAYFVQQSDDNFVFYTTNASYAARPVWSIYANSSTSALGFGVPVNFNSNVGALTANGSVGATNQVLTSNGSTVYWSSPGAASVNSAAQYTWTNTHTFQANVAFTGNNISVVSNTGSVMFAGASDTNWRIGRSTGSVTKFYYTNNSLDFISGGSNLEGFTFGAPGVNTYLETGSAGTFTKNPIYVGNSSVNVTINSTSFTGSSNNASYLGGVAAAGYLRSNTSGTYSGGVLRFTNDTGVLGSSTGEANTLQIYQANVNADAFQTFHVSGDTAVHFGLDGTTNDLFVGGWSLGANKYKVWHQNNDGSGSGLDADLLDGVNGANYVQNTDSRTLSGNLNFTGANTSISGNLTIQSTGELIISNGAGIYANASLGNTGQVLTSDGAGVYWSTVSGGGGGGFTNGQSISVNNFVITGGFTANSSNGTSGQVLTSNGSGLYWSSATVTTVASIETEITADGPLAWWKFNETSGTTITNYGSLGSNANLTLSGSWTLAAAKIVPSSSDSFAFCATSTSYAGTANNILGAPASGDHTLEAIVVLTNDGTNANRVISISDVGETAATNYQAGLMVTTAGELFDFWEYGSGTNVSVDSNVLVRRGEPLHLAFVKNSTAKTVTFYVNGVKTNVLTYANEPTGGTTAYTRVGNNGTDTTSRFTVAHTAIYNKQLSDARVLAHAKAAGLAYTPNYVTTSLASGSFGYNLIFGG